MRRGRYRGRYGDATVPLVVFLLVLMLGSAWFWWSSYRDCRARGADWVLLKDALGWPTCVKVAGREP